MNAVCRLNVLNKYLKLGGVAVFFGHTYTVQDLY